MASREGMLFKFFEKWKEKRLNKFAKQALKDNPDLEKALKDIDKMHQKAMRGIIEPYPILHKSYTFCAYLIMRNCAGME